ncbi:MAG: hypothetical protein K8T91_27500 [Planctomycetes bacterium]|nr:hypothetical protein [Planctomycetota bacterium]
MPITSVAGEIFQVAPHYADAAVVWLRGGFNERANTWRNAIEGAYAGRGLPAKPWISPEDQVLILEPPVGRLRWLYVFANLADTLGYDGYDEVPQAVHRSFSALAARLAVVEKPIVAMAHIPARNLLPPLAAEVCPEDITHRNWAEGQGVPDEDDFAGGPAPTRDDNQHCALEMISAIRAWQAEHPSTIDTVYLVDLEGGFARFLQ